MSTSCRYMSKLGGIPYTHHDVQQIFTFDQVVIFHLCKEKRNPLLMLCHMIIYH